MRRQGQTRKGSGGILSEVPWKLDRGWKESFSAERVCGQMGKHMGAIDLIHMITFFISAQTIQPQNGFYSKLRIIRYINYFFLMKFLEGGIESKNSTCFISYSPGDY